jgi:hypothetical protein
VLNETEQSAQIFEIKRNEKHIRYNLLKEKAAAMLVKTGELKGYEIEYNGLSMTNMVKNRFAFARANFNRVSHKQKHRIIPHYPMFFVVFVT